MTHHASLGGAGGAGLVSADTRSWYTQALGVGVFSQHVQSVLGSALLEFMSSADLSK